MGWEISRHVSTKETMKTKIVSQLCILGLAVAALSVAGAARAETSAAGDSSSLSAKDKTFMKKAAKGGMFEVTMGKLAEQMPKARM